MTNPSEFFEKAMIKNFGKMTEAQKMVGRWAKEWLTENVFSICPACASEFDFKQREKFTTETIDELNKTREALKRCNSSLIAAERKNHSALKQAEKLAEALEKNRDTVICMDGSRHWQGKECKFCAGASAIEQALAEYRQESEK